jgi:hypothetical protein
MFSGSRAGEKAHICHTTSYNNHVGCRDFVCAHSPCHNLLVTTMSDYDLKSPVREYFVHSEPASLEVDITSFCDFHTSFPKDLPSSYPIETLTPNKNFVTDGVAGLRAA